MGLITRHFEISREVFLGIELDPLDVRSSLECAIVHELIIADLIVFDGNDLPGIVHETRHLRRLGSWSGTDIEDHLS